MILQHPRSNHLGLPGLAALFWAPRVPQSASGLFGDPLPHLSLTPPGFQELKEA